ncbi:uncharacterized protein LTR77_004831 [Saxophila tyrrhenica]|uniref:Uncharacterized protein n=1 Tax=Saxophila tyrrhenica TaxID=1690608 RepID=A0AAV9PAW4_9PEZI|nr:hypothetical protein LTR77_004831 [Saxophila tyrrhenica]
MDLSDLDFNDPDAVMRAMGGGAGTNLPVPTSLSPQQVRREARDRSKQIFADWYQLRAILDRHAPAIHKRWGKKTKNQRKEILLAVWPNMAATHRPDFAAFRKENERQRAAGTKFRDAYMWPYINLEDLSKPRTLLLFLESRSRKTPDVFAAAGEDAAHLGMVTQAVVPGFLNEYTMMFTGRTTPQTYGELIAWEDNDKAFDWLMSQRGMHPGQGLLLLEMQQRTLHFLVGCCERIMHDIPPEDLGGEQHTIQAQPALPKEMVNGFDSRAVMAAEAPYRVPAGMDLARLESLFTARATAAEDHIWALREDPGYFAEALFELKEHRQELIRHPDGSEHPLFKFKREEILWSRVIGSVVTSAYLSLEVKDLRRLQTKHETNIAIDLDLPEEYLYALLKFQHYLGQGSKGVLGQLKYATCASPSFRPWFVRAPNGDPTYTKMQVGTKPNLQLRKIEGELLWLMRVLWEDGHDLFLAGLTNVVDELERLVHSEPAAKKLLSPYVAENIGDLAIITEAMRQLQIYQPWAASFEHEMVDRSKSIKEEFARTSQPWEALLQATEGPNHGKIMRLGDPSDKKFYHPVDKRRSKENVEAMRRAEENVDAFWLAVDQNLQMKPGNQIESTVLHRLLAQSRTLQRTPEWEDPNASGSGKTAVVDVEGLSRPLSDLYFDLQRRTERAIDHDVATKRVKTKEKTRGVARPQSSVTAPQPTSNEQDPQPTFSVDARALKVFRTLFYTPSLSATPGEVPWTDFLHALASTGFKPEKLYGSVWQFQPTNLDVERSIQFHEPHPNPKLPYRTVRRFGRRLERAYGWFGGMFQLAKKDD